MNKYVRYEKPAAWHESFGKVACRLAALDLRLLCISIHMFGNMMS